MNSNEEIKEMVKQKYAEIALQNQDTNASSCCGSGGCSTEVYNIMTDDYDHLEGYNPDADLKLGCRGVKLQRWSGRGRSETSGGSSRTSSCHGSRAC